MARFANRTDYIIDFGNGGQFIARNDIAVHPIHLGYLSLSTGNGGWNSFGVKVLDDLKVHHLVADCRWDFSDCFMITETKLAQCNKSHWPTI